MGQKLIDIEFETDHPTMHKGASTACHELGLPLRKPHWKAGTNGAKNTNHPVSFTRWTQMRVLVRIKNTDSSWTGPRSRQLVVEGISKKQNWKFSSPFVMGSHPGLTVQVPLTCETRLPNKVTRICDDISWYVRDRFQGKREFLGETGTHEIFVLWGKPLVKSSTGLDNRVTYGRLLKLTSSLVSGGLSSVPSIADKLHKYCNRQMSSSMNGLINGKDSSTWRALHSYGHHVWALADFAPKHAPGMCAEATMLMEMMLRQLGIHAVQKHVYATDDASVIKAEKNVSWADNGKTHHPTVRKRNHAYSDKNGAAHHGEEQLWMNFGGNPGTYGLQFGEGCCEIKLSNKRRRLYAGLVDLYGEENSGRNPVHDLMLKLEQKYKWHFLTWAHHNNQPCAKGPFPKVPS